MLDKDRIKQFMKLFHSLEIGWQVYSITIIYLLITFAALFLRWQIGLMLLFLLIITFFVLYFNYENIIRNLNLIANQLSTDVKNAQEDSIYRAPIGVLLYNPSDHRIKWINPMMQHMLGDKDLVGTVMDEIDEKFVDLLSGDDKQWQIMNYRNHSYKVLHQKESNALYLMDVTEEVDIRNLRKIDRTVFGYLFLDDYNEIVESMDDKQSTTFDSEVITDINYWAKEYGIYMKRIDDEKFILLLNQYVLEQLEKDRFKYYDTLREKYLTRNTPLSFSIGIAYPEEDLYSIDELAIQAQANLDLALGRGGDQVVVRSKSERARFYGGKTDQSQKRTNIRSRLVYQGLKTSITHADNIIIGGHRTPDLDSIGSALGLYRICKILKKPTYIVVNEEDFNKDVRKLLEMEQAAGLWDAEILVDIDHAKQVATKNSLVVMVDHHRPSLSEVEPLIGKYDTVIIDHHRRGEEFPEGPVLTYIEPYASSTSEMITEFFINMRNTTESLNEFEATALLAGVIVDTNNFTNRTGSRTFDVASYLKSRGADSGQIQRIMRENLAHMLQRSEMLEKTQMIEGKYAVIVADNDIIIDNVTAAQSADFLLEVEDVEASFVIYRRTENTVGISARSLGEENVQTIMERLGGGGHLSNAATQIEGVTTQEAYNQLFDQLIDQSQGG